MSNSNNFKEVIALSNVTLWRRTQEEFSYDLKRTIFSIVTGQYRKPAKKLILQDLSFTIQSGEKIGIIGTNGSGKSTLLKVICGILKPTAGDVKVRGNIAPLIELGAGFEPEISVEDNIILYGVLLGFSRREMIQRVPAILKYAELEEYLLRPVKSLSSGMAARLGFAIATDVQPDILILDEVLSVGDERFKEKSRQRMNELWQEHTTVLVVSHDLRLIEQTCDKALWLNQGVIQAWGEAKTVVSDYLGSFAARS